MALHGTCNNQGSPSIWKYCPEVFLRSRGTNTAAILSSSRSPPPRAAVGSQCCHKTPPRLVLKPREGPAFRTFLLRVIPTTPAGPSRVKTSSLPSLGLIWPRVLTENPTISNLLRRVEQHAGAIGVQVGQRKLSHLLLRSHKRSKFVEIGFKRLEKAQNDRKMAAPG